MWNYNLNKQYFKGNIWGFYREVPGLMIVGFSNETDFYYLR